MSDRVGDLGQHGLFAIAKARFALDLEDRRNRHAELALELGVGVDERLGEAPRELASERRLARARQPDQKQIAPMQMHPRIVVDWVGDLLPSPPRRRASYDGSRHLMALIESLITRGVRKMRSSCFSLVRPVVLNR